MNIKQYFDYQSDLTLVQIEVSGEEVLKAGQYLKIKREQGARYTNLELMKILRMIARQEGLEGA